MFKGWLAALTLLVLPLVACNTTFQVSVDEENTTITMTMGESDVAALITPILEGGEQSQLSNTTVDLRPGEIFVSGDVRPEPAGPTYPGSLGIRIAAQNGDLVVELTSLDFAGFELNQQTISRINRDIADGLAQAATRNNGQARLTDITITNDTLSMTLVAPRQQ
ncbi:MAG: hypothetical protein GYB67_12860 [Chloroflexi bacterium]|nr:hypothetical protein [Chloroflexota bacterium]